MKITLDTIEQFTWPLERHPLGWKFETTPGLGPSLEFQDQITVLSPEATAFLLDFRSSQTFLHTPYFLSEEKTFRQGAFKHVAKFLAGGKEPRDVKKWLYSRGIPFSNKVFWIPDSSESGFVLTWKIVIKFSEEIFWGSDELIWDKTLNWALNYFHHEVFYFGKDRIYNAETEAEEKRQHLLLLRDWQERAEKLKNEKA